MKDTPFYFATRFAEESGINPEELLAAAQASCFSMALANELEISGLTPIPFKTKASVPFLLAASNAKKNCPIARGLMTKVNLHTESQDQPFKTEADAEIVVYTSSHCQICGQAKALLERQGIRYREVDLDLEAPEQASALKKKTGLTRVPQIFAGEHFIGSYEDLVRLDEDHGLRLLLKGFENSNSPY